MAGCWCTRRSGPRSPRWRRGPPAGPVAGAGPGGRWLRPWRCFRSWSFLSPLLCDGTVEHRADEALGVGPVGRRAGDEDPVVDRPGQLVDQDGVVDVAAKSFPLAGALQ